GGPGTAGSTVNAGGASVATAQHIASYVDDPAKAGQSGFWPTMVNVPGAPGTPAAVAGNGRATLSWTAPTSGSAPFTYTITSSPAGAACAVTGLTALCTGLANLTPYTFNVTATNASGSAVSSASVAIQSTPEEWFVDDGPSVTCDDAGTALDPFQSVQCAISAATSGDTIRVAAGDYAGFAIDKALTIVGPNDEVATGPGITRASEAVITSPVSIASGVDGVTLSGFSLSSTNSEDVGLSIGSNSRNVTITYNEITGFDQGIRSAGNDANFGSDMVVSHNYIHGLSLAASGSYSIHLRNVKNLTVSENIITDSVSNLTGSQMRRGIALRGTQNAVVSNNIVDFGSVASAKAYYAISIAQFLNDGGNGNDLAVSDLDITGNTLSGAVNGVNFLELGAQATDVLIDGNTARDVFVGVSFKSFGQTGSTVVSEALIQRNDFSNIDSGVGVLSAGVQVYSIDVTAPATNEFDGVVVNGNKLPSNKINELADVNGLLVGAINPFAPGFPNILTFYPQDINDVDARANHWGSTAAPTTDITRQANVAGWWAVGSFSNDPSKAGKPGFWPLSNDANLSGLSPSSRTLSPVFDSGTTSYTLSVPVSVTSFAFTPTKSDNKASIVQYSGETGTNLFTGALGGRETVIRFVVTAEDGTKKTYRVTVSRINFTAQIITFTPGSSLSATTPLLALTASANSGLPVAF
ncbi:MAG: cadherin-like beta sandwich domain-containing protein, partial [Microbacteriaceae bacterium]